MNKTSKIYVAGHTGLVGDAIIRQLQSQGYNNLIYYTHQEIDLTNQQQVNHLFSKEQPEYVFLAAAKVGGIYANNKYRADYIYTNLQIQNNIIHSSYLHKVKKLLFLGSSCIYPKNAPQPMTESCLLTGELEYTNEPYAIAKIAGLKMCESYNLQYNTNFIGVMPTNLYGHNDNFDLENSHVLPAIIRKTYLAKLLTEQNYSAIAKNLNMNNNNEINAHLQQHGISTNNGKVLLKLWGSGKAYREFLHVNDMADACIFVMQNINFPDLIKDSPTTEIRNTHINIGSGQDISIKDLADMISSLIGFFGEIMFDNSKPDGTMKKLQNVNKLTQLGWRYKTTLRDGIKQVIENYIH
jgi:GDP-L-fucose synthase